MTQPRTEPACRYCGTFASSMTCYPCSRSPLMPHLVRAKAEVAALRDRVGELLDALQKIRGSCGKVCKRYESCSHAACASSYRAWVLADKALSGEGTKP